jgi:predicted secreted Zn-dependent protease
MPKQKLSLKAKIAKKKRDLAAANTDRRKKMRAENQRRRRAAIKAGKNIKGKDYDHKTKRFTSIKANRGNRGHGTRNE